MHIFRTDISQAVKQGELAENNFIVKADGQIRPLGPIGKQLWQTFGKYAWVRETFFGVNNEKLAKLLEEQKETKELESNVKYLGDKGQFTTDRQNKILRTIQHNKLS